MPEHIVSGVAGGARRAVVRAEVGHARRATSAGGTALLALATITRPPFAQQCGVRNTRQRRNNRYAVYAPGRISPYGGSVTHEDNVSTAGAARYRPNVRRRAAAAAKHVKRSPKRRDSRIIRHRSGRAQRSVTTLRMLATSQRSRHVKYSIAYNTMSHTYSARPQNETSMLVYYATTSRAQRQVGCRLMFNYRMLFNIRPGQQHNNGAGVCAGQRCSYVVVKVEGTVMVALLGRNWRAKASTKRFHKTVRFRYGTASGNCCRRDVDVIYICVRQGAERA